MNASESLYAQMAKKHVADFEHESTVMRDHQEAMDCWNCDAFLQLGIDAYTWLTRADESYRRCVYADEKYYSPEFEQIIEQLFRAWLGPTAFAKQWIAQVVAKDYQLGNLEQFRKCEAEVRALVRFLDKDEMSEPLRRLRDEAIAEFKNGSTAEFV